MDADGAPSIAATLQRLTFLTLTMVEYPYHCKAEPLTTSNNAYSDNQQASTFAASCTLSYANLISFKWFNNFPLNQTTLVLGIGNAIPQIATCDEIYPLPIL